MQESHEIIESYLAACAAVQTAFSDIGRELMMAFHEEQLMGNQQAVVLRRRGVSP